MSTISYRVYRSAIKTRCPKCLNTQQRVASIETTRAQEKHTNSQTPVCETGGEGADLGRVPAHRARGDLVLLLGFHLRDGRAGRERHRRRGLLGLCHFHPAVRHRRHPVMLHGVLHLLRQGSPGHG